MLLLVVVATCLFFLVERLDFFFWGWYYCGDISWVGSVCFYLFFFFFTFPFLWGVCGGIFPGVVINQLPI